MAGALAGGTGRRWRRAADFVDRVYGEMLSYEMPLGYEQTLGMVSNSHDVDIHLEGLGSIGSGLSGEQAIEDLDRLTLDGENVENVDFQYRYGVFSDRFEAAIRISQEGEAYILGVEGRR